MSDQLKKTARSQEATQQKASSSEEQQQEKINEVRGLLGSLTEEMPSFMSDATIRRFLRARNWSMEQATKGLKETVKWRRDYRPDAISWDDVAEMENEVRRTHVADYLDKNGRSVLVSNVPMKSKVSAKEQIKHLVYLLEYFATNSADEQDDFVVWLTDFRGWSISSTPLSITRESIHIIQNYYPGVIGVAIPFDPPRIFESFWKIAKNFVQADMKEKVKFVYANKPESLKTIADIFDLDTLESSFGGRSARTAFDINKYAERMRRADKMRGASKDSNGHNHN
ncbi:phosphatidylinositol transfer protein 3-like [Triticum dicoccoides]|uniref:phosphatidylinositol transfer protein 3-like n=1 Tax=Triticum dicoccoides TaxID=85692 RepID=UPI000E7BBC19|nr:phosphatidylinositol transfer protein 3-like [Triticum dicoccoides]